MKKSLDILIVTVIMGGFLVPASGQVTNVTTRKRRTP